MWAQQIRKDYLLQIIETNYNKQAISSLFIQKKILFAKS